MITDRTPHFLEKSTIFELMMYYSMKSKTYSIQKSVIDKL